MKSKNELINDLKKLRDNNYHIQAENVKKYLLLQFPGEDAFKTNNEAYDKYIFIKNNYKKESWSCKYQSISFKKNIIGSKHIDYKDQSPIQMVVNEAKRMKSIFNYLADNPEYFFDKPSKNIDNPISYIRFFTKDGNEEFIAFEGNHRTAMGRYLQSICFQNEVAIYGVSIMDHEIDYEQVKLINSAKIILEKFDFTLSIRKVKISGVNCVYNLIECIHIFSNKNDFSLSLSLKYHPDNIEKSIDSNDLKIKDFLNNIENKLPKLKRCIYEFKSCFNNMKKIFTILTTNINKG